METVQIKGKTYKLVEVKSSKAGKKQNNDTGLKYWTKRGFKVTKTGFNQKASNGKTYPAVKGVTKDGVEMTLLATRGGNVYCRAF